MIIGCPRCNARFKVLRETLTPGVSRYKCPKCGTALVLKTPPEKLRNIPPEHAQRDADISGGSASKDKALHSATSTVKAAKPTAEFAGEQAFYCAGAVKIIAVCGFAGLSVLALAFSINTMTFLERMWAVIMWLMVAGFATYFIWRIKTPIVTLSPDGIRHYRALGRNTLIGWKDITSFTVDKQSYAWKMAPKIHLTTVAADEETTFDVEYLDSLNSDRLIALLEGRIPRKEPGDALRDVLSSEEPVHGKQTYRKWTLDESGIRFKDKLIPWASVTQIKYPPMVVGGFASVTVFYIDTFGKNKSFKVPPKTSEEYRAFLSRLVRMSPNADISPAILGALKYPAHEAQADMFALVLVSGSIILTLCLTVPLIDFFAPTPDSRLYYMALTCLPITVPLGFALLNLVRSIRGKRPPRARRFAWSAAAFAGPFAGLAIFFLISPISYYWFAGQINMRFDNYKRAEGYYEKALSIDPDNIDIVFEQGELFLDMGRNEDSFASLSRAYEMNPTYWRAFAAAMIPESLMKMNRFDEALDWCERILEDNEGERGFSARTIERMEDRILREKRRYERAQRNAR